VVEDTGRGIPAAELASVVQFGYRGSNVADVRSHGAGCGLTKAFLVARQFGGRFWIASELGRGTRIRFRIPPVAAGAVAPTALQE
jgi:signal transduction histidine kinase